MSDGRLVARTDRGPIEYELSGTGGPVVVSLHGGMGGADQGRLIAGWLDDEPYRILSPSRPGYLGTPVASGRTWDEQADLVVALLDQLAFDRVALLALSASGPLAYTLAARHPDRVWALVAIDCVSGSYESPQTVGRLAEALFMSTFGQRLVRFVAARFPRAFVDSTVGSLGHFTTTQRKQRAAHILATPDALAFITALVDTTYPYAVRKAGNENDTAQLRATEVLPWRGVRCPTLVVHGTLDADVQFHHGVRAYEAIAGAERHWIADGDHLGFWLSPAAPSAQESARAFLRKHSPAMG